MCYMAVYCNGSRDQTVRNQNNWKYQSYACSAYDWELLKEYKMLVKFAYLFSDVSL